MFQILPLHGCVRWSNETGDRPGRRERDWERGWVGGREAGREAGRDCVVGNGSMETPEKVLEVCVSSTPRKWFILEMVSGERHRTRKSQTSIFDEFRCKPPKQMLANQIHPFTVTSFRVYCRIIFIVTHTCHVCIAHGVWKLYTSM